MNCVQCGNVLSETDYCTSCGEDVRVYKKIIYMSNRFYNMGLIRAQNRDLSGAADLLQRSVRLNKKNTQARNLLGLVYFEMGEVVQALSQWVISQNFQPLKNLADEYINTIQENPNRFDAINQSIKKYNTGLQYAQQGSDDLAIIQLKKVLSVNPNLIKAYQLITLLYIKTEDYDRARKMIHKALRIDACNPISLQYEKEINAKYTVKEETNKKEPQIKREENGETNREYLSGYDVIIPPSTYKEPSNGAMTVLNVIIGIIIGAAVVYCLVTPARIASVKNDSSAELKEYNNKIVKLESDIKTRDNQIETLNSEKKDLENSGDNSKSKISDYENLLSAYNSYVAKDYVTSANHISKISDTSSASNSFQTLYTTVQKKSYKEAAAKLMEEAEEQFNGSDYKNAIKSYKKVCTYDTTSAAAVYMLARAYEKNGDNDNAKKYYQQVVDKFPDSDQAERARSALDK